MPRPSSSRRPEAGNPERISTRYLPLLSFAGSERGRSHGGRSAISSQGSGNRIRGGAMKNTDPRIDAHIEKAAGFAKPILRHLRKLVHEACPDAEETLKWSMPTFVYRGKILCGMAAFKGHCTFGFWHQGMTAVLGPEGEKSDTAMGSFGRLTSLDDLPSGRTMTRYIKKAASLTE